MQQVRRPLRQTTDDAAAQTRQMPLPAPASSNPDQGMRIRRPGRAYRGSGHAWRQTAAVTVDLEVAGHRQCPTQALRRLPAATFTTALPSFTDTDTSLSMQHAATALSDAGAQRRAKSSKLLHMQGKKFPSPNWREHVRRRTVNDEPK